MAKIRLPKGSGKRLKVREKSVKSQGILKWILSGNPVPSRLVNDLEIYHSILLVPYSHSFNKQSFEYTIMNICLSISFSMIWLL